MGDVEPTVGARPFAQLETEPAGNTWRNVGDVGLLEQLDARRGGGERQVLVDVGAQPMRVRHFVVGARRHQQAALVALAVAKGRARLVRVEREAALEAAPQVGQVAAPATVGRQAVEIVETVALGEALERERRQRRRRFADREAGMAAALEQDHVVTLPGEHAGEDRAGEAGAEDRDGGSHAPQAAHAIAGCGSPVRLIASSRRRRAAKHVGQTARRSRSQRSAVTTVARSRGETGDRAHARAARDPVA